MNDGMQFGYSSTGATDPRTFTPDQMKKWNAMKANNATPVTWSTPNLTPDERARLFKKEVFYRPGDGKNTNFGQLNNALSSQSLSDEDRSGILRNLFSEGGGLESATGIASMLADPSKAETSGVKAFRATEQYYKLLVDKPGAKQTRSPDLFLSNAFKGMV